MYETPYPSILIKSLAIVFYLTTWSLLGVYTFLETPCEEKLSNLICAQSLLENMIDVAMYLSN